MACRRLKPGFNPTSVIIGPDIVKTPNAGVVGTPYRGRSCRGRENDLPTWATLGSETPRSAGVVAGRKNFDKF
jgi:hypothetical protein